jgi:PAS domain-containing protein
MISTLAQSDQLALAVIKAARDTMGVNIDAAMIQRVSNQLSPGTSNQVDAPGVYSRLKTAVSYVVSGVNSGNFFGPWQPLRPLADRPEQGVIGRQYDYPVGQNLRIQPRAGENTNFTTLRGLADDYDLLRLAIETCKDQIESFQWQVIPEDEKADASKFKDAIKAATDFFTYPDREHNWSQWLRMIVEDMLVLDAVCIFPQKTRGGDAYSFDLVDGATIKKVIDEYGRSPMPPSPAYQQVIKGIPAVDYTRDDLVYLSRNPRTNRLYGYSPVEQVVMTVSIAMRRQISQLQFYTEGNVPEALVSTPDTWNADMVKDFQGWWDSMMEGNTAARRHMKFVPNLGNGKIIFPKESILKDEYDEWLARIICFALSLAPTALIKQTNRATSEQVAETAKEEGQMPRMRFLAAQFTWLIKTYLKLDGVKFAWQTDAAMDPFQRAQASQIYLVNKVVTPDEVRDSDLGYAPLSVEQDLKLNPPAQEPAAPSPMILKPGETAHEPTTGKPLFGNPAPKAEPAVTKIDVHPPQVVMGDTFVRVMPGEPPLVKVGDVHVHHTTTMDPAKPMKKHVLAKRDPKTGDLVGEITEVVDEVAA